ncbi:MerR family transcriptional regulator [Phytoactinopolyspora mesophila]|uniref:MerR family transcriptional regulator n=1 Tax=Phytoactinopolyspora mesophila TaxID=2650750 RepID=UPI001391B678
MTAIQPGQITTSPHLGVSEAADHTGVSAHTLRYYERIGLLRVRRDASGHRLYGSHDIQRVMFITRLRQTDMPIREIQRYFALADAGPATEPERLELLTRHREAVRAKLQTLGSALEAIELKIDIYGGAGCPPASTS